MQAAVVEVYEVSISALDGTVSKAPGVRLRVGHGHGFDVQGRNSTSLPAWPSERHGAKNAAVVRETRQSLYPLEFHTASRRINNSPVQDVTTLLGWNVNKLSQIVVSKYGLEAVNLVIRNNLAVKTTQ